jgi:hypothetical protein
VPKITCTDVTWIAGPHLEVGVVVGVHVGVGARAVAANGVGDGSATLGMLSFLAAVKEPVFW